MKFEWKTLASAPYDGTWVAVKCEGYTPDVASFDKATGKWKNVSNWEGEVYEQWPLTHWSPLPEIRTDLKEQVND